MASGFMVEATIPYLQSNRRRGRAGSYCRGQPPGRRELAPRREASIALALLLAVALVALVAAAEAVLPPWIYKEARDKAMFHVQVRVLRVTPPRPTPGTCEVAGTVVRIFRDRAGGVHVGDRIDFGVSCVRAGDPTAPGATLWTDVTRLRRARFLEVFLNREGTRYEVALWQSRIIEHETARPTWPAGDR
jgi:hypothetical protein